MTVDCGPWWQSISLFVFNILIQLTILYIVEWSDLWKSSICFWNCLHCFDLQDFGDGGAFPEIHVAQYPLILINIHVQWHPVNTVTNGPKKSAILLLHENEWRILLGMYKKVAVITRWLYYRGSPKVGFHCIIIIIIIVIIIINNNNFKFNFNLIFFLKQTKQSALQVLILKSLLGVLQWWNAVNVTFCLLVLRWHNVLDSNIYLLALKLVLFPLHFTL